MVAIGSGIEIKRHCAERVPRHMIVDSVVFLQELPRIDVPQCEVTPENLKDLDSYVAMLMRLG